MLPMTSATPRSWPIRPISERHYPSHDGRSLSFSLSLSGGSLLADSRARLGRPGRPPIGPRSRRRGGVNRGGIQGAFSGLSLSRFRCFSLYVSPSLFLSPSLSPFLSPPLTFHHFLSLSLSVSLLVFLLHFIFSLVEDSFSLPLFLSPSPSPSFF